MRAFSKHTQPTRRQRSNRQDDGTYARTVSILKCQSNTYVCHQSSLADPSPGSEPSSLWCACGISLASSLLGRLLSAASLLSVELTAASSDWLCSCVEEASVVLALFALEFSAPRVLRALRRRMNSILPWLDPWPRARCRPARRTQGRGQCVRRKGACRTK